MTKSAQETIKSFDQLYRHIAMSIKYSRRKQLYNRCLSRILSSEIDKNVNKLIDDPTDIKDELLKETGERFGNQFIKDMCKIIHQNNGDDKFRVGDGKVDTTEVDITNHPLYNMFSQIPEANIRTLKLIDVCYRI